MHSLADLDANNALNVVVELVIAGLILWLVMWFVGWVGVPEPFAKVIKVLVGLFVLVFLVNVLLSIRGHGFISYGHS